jgi:hypothetical protein
MTQTAKSYVHQYKLAPEMVDINLHASVYDAALAATGTSTPSDMVRAAIERALNAPPKLTTAREILTEVMAMTPKPDRCQVRISEEMYDDLMGSYWFEGNIHDRTRQAIGWVIR